MPSCQSGQAGIVNQAKQGLSIRLLAKEPLDCKLGTNTPCQLSSRVRIRFADANIYYKRRQNNIQFPKYAASKKLSVLVTLGDGLFSHIGGISKSSIS